MCTSAGKKQNKFILVLPVNSDVALTVTFILFMQRMVMMLAFKLFIFPELLNYCIKVFSLEPALLCLLDLTLKTCRTL